MTATEKTMLFIVVIAIAFLAWTRQQSGASNVGPLVSQDNLVPWYLNYNTQPANLPVTNAVLPSLVSGIQNDSGNPPCALCNLFGTSYGSQY